MYQSKKKQVRWQFEFQLSPEQIAEKPENPPPLKITLIPPNNPILIQNEIKIEEQEVPQIQQQVQKIPIPKHTKSKNYYVFNRDIYILNNVEVCDFACQYSPPRLSSKNKDSEGNAHEYTIEKPRSEGQNVPVLSGEGQFDQFSKLNSEKISNELEGKDHQEEIHLNQDEIIECNISEEEKENRLINKMVDMKHLFGQRKNDPESFLIIQQLTSQIEQLQGIKENQQVVISRLIEYMRNEVVKQNKIIAKQQELYDQEKQFKYKSNKASVSSQTIKKIEIEQNELPKLLGYIAQSLEQNIEQNEYTATYQLKYGHAIITYKAQTKLKQSEELNKIMQDFAEKFNSKQLHIVGLDLRINGIANNFFPYAELIQSVVSKRYETVDGQIDKNYIPNIINLLPHMVKQLRKIEKQIILIEQYGVIWTHLYPEAKLVLLLGYRSLLKQDHIEQDQIVLRVDYDLIEFRYEIQFEVSRLQALSPFYSKMYDINYLQVGQQFPIGTSLHDKLLQLEESQAPISQILRTLNASKLE